MKRKLISILILLCTLPLYASAQWYLFPSKKAEDTTKAEKKEAEEQDGMSDVIELTFSLPLQAASTKPNDNFLEMYSGALIALRDLGDEGIKIHLDVRDTENSSFKWSEMQFGDVNIGPVSTADLKEALAFCPSDKTIISPLDPKASEIIDTCSIIQAPVHWKSQIDDMIDWVISDAGPTDEIIVLKDSLDVGIGEQTSYILDCLNRNEVRFRTVHTLSSVHFSEFSHYRFIIASDRDLYITSVVRDLGIAGSLNSNLCLYATSKVRGCISSDIMDLHNARTRLSTGYFIDYESPEVERFILTYRALFGNEPGSFAFQGYDTAHYFLTLCHKYGSQWHKKITDYSEKGLQSSFKFIEREDAGQINTGVRRVIFSQDLSSALQ